MERNFRFARGDLLLVSVEVPLGVLADYCDIDFDKPSRDILAKGKLEVKEIAVASRDKTRFVLLREFDEKIIRESAGIIKPKVFIDGEPCYETDFYFAPNPSKGGEFIGVEFAGDEYEEGKTFESAEADNKKCIARQLIYIAQKLEYKHKREEREKAFGRDVYQAIFEM